ncbi:hypothetical protein ikelab_09440 [Lactococcus garvieae]|uniref:Uncharacterized protein n=1 Tax=Lactococcus garvieae TaxID=1363 RepID=A0A6L2ZUF3_9LACT|nr:hypothetical protein [Lactococcus garvieae]GFO51669.1 hypothetical protein ikelab_09440 [Lactococcus garvieae]
MKLFKIIRSIIIAVCIGNLIYGLITHQNNYSYIFTLIIAIALIPDIYKIYQERKKES